MEKEELKYVVSDAEMLKRFCSLMMKVYSKFGLVYISPLKKANGVVSIKFRKRSEEQFSIINLPDGFSSTEIVDYCQRAIEAYLTGFENLPQE